MQRNVFPVHRLISPEFGALDMHLAWFFFEKWSWFVHKLNLYLAYLIITLEINQRRFASCGLNFSCFNSVFRSYWNWGGISTFLVSSSLYINVDLFSTLKTWKILSIMVCDFFTEFTRDDINWLPTILLYFYMHAFSLFPHPKVTLLSQFLALAIMSICTKYIGLQFSIQYYRFHSVTFRFARMKFVNNNHYVWDVAVIICSKDRNLLRTVHIHICIKRYIGNILHL